MRAVARRNRVKLVMAAVAVAAIVIWALPGSAEHDDGADPDQGTVVDPNNPLANIICQVGPEDLVQDDASGNAGFFIRNATPALEGDSGQQQFAFDIELSDAQSVVSHVEWVTASHQARSGHGDYDIACGRATFAAGITLQTVEVQVNGDTLSERDEAFGIFLYDATPSGSVTILDHYGEGLILDDDNDAVNLEVWGETIPEHFALSKTIDAHDMDITVAPKDAQTLVWNVTGLPAGATATPTGDKLLIRWTPGESAGGSTNPFQVTVQDQRPLTGVEASEAGEWDDPLNLTSDSATFFLNVTEVDDAPELGTVSAVTGPEMTLLSSGPITAVDPEGETVFFSLIGGDAPGGQLNVSRFVDGMATNFTSNATVDLATGAITWWPSEAFGPGNYTFTVEANTTSGVANTTTVIFNVEEVNRVPDFESIGDPPAEEHITFTLDVNATDPDLKPVPDTVTFSLDDGPTGASINATTGVITWPITEADGGTAPTFTVNATDGVGGWSTLTFTLFVVEIDDVPVFSGIMDVAGPEHVVLTLDVNATDPEGGTPWFSMIDDAGTGAFIHNATGVITFATGEIHGGSDYQFTIGVYGTSASTDFTSATVWFNVTEVDDKPYITTPPGVTGPEHGWLTLDVDAIDPEGATVSFSLTNAAGTNASINASSGILSLWGAESLGGSNLTLTVAVNGSATDTNLTTVWFNVTEVDDSPIFGGLGDGGVTGPEHVTLTFDVNATDPDGGPVWFSITDDGGSGATIDNNTGLISFATGEVHGGTNYTIAVQANGTLGGADAVSTAIWFNITEVDDSPVFDDLADGGVTGPEHSMLFFGVSATDPEGGDVWFSLVDAAGTNATIDNTTGAISLWGDESLGGMNITLTVGANATAGAADLATVYVWFNVTEIDDVPVFGDLGEGGVTGPEHTWLNVSVSATDPEGNAVWFSIVDDDGSGATIDNTTGLLSLLAGEAHGANNYTVTVRANATAGGSDAATVDIWLNVLEVQDPPILDPSPGFPPVDVSEHDVLGHDFNGSDPEGLPVSFFLSGGPHDGGPTGAIPAGAAMNLTTGNFSWTPNGTQAGDYAFYVCITDNQTVPLPDDPEISVCRLVEISVALVDDAPIFEDLGDFPPATIDEHVTVTHDVNATDNETAIRFFLSTESTEPSAPSGVIPSNATINETTGVLSWTPAEDEDGPALFYVCATDNTTAPSPVAGLPSQTVCVPIDSTIIEVNAAPVLSGGAALATITEDDLDSNGTLVSTLLAGIATDSDLPAQDIGIAVTNATGNGVWQWSSDNGTSWMNITGATDANSILVPHDALLRYVPDGVNGEVAKVVVRAWDGTHPTPVQVAAGDRHSCAVLSDGTVTCWGSDAYGQGSPPTGVNTTVNGGTTAFSAAAHDLTIDVTELEDAPIFGDLGDGGVTGFEHTTLTFNVTATDPEGLAVTYALTDAAGTNATINETTGVLSLWGSEALGGMNLTFTVTANATGADHTATTVWFNVTEFDDLPIFDPATGVTGPEHTLLGLQVGATDPDGVPVWFSISDDGGSGATIDNVTGMVTLDANETHGGNNYTVTVQANGTAGGADAAFTTIWFNVLEVDDMPDFSDLGAGGVSGLEHTLLTFNVTATDPEELPVTYTLTNANGTNATINETTGVLSLWGSEALGGMNLTLEVTVNATGADHATVDVWFNVIEVNDFVELTIDPLPGNHTPPELFEDPQLNDTVLLYAFAFEHQEFGFVLNGTDPEGATVTYCFVHDDSPDAPFSVSAWLTAERDVPSDATINGVPAWTLNTTTGEFRWTPTESDGMNMTDPEGGSEPYPGLHFFWLCADDGETQTLQSFALLIYETDDAPVFDTMPFPVTERVRRTINETVVASDPEGGLVTYSLRNGTEGGVPDGLTINETTGQVTWEIGSRQRGTFIFDICARDAPAPAGLETCHTTHILTRSSGGGGGGGTPPPTGGGGGTLPPEDGTGGGGQTGDRLGLDDITDSDGDGLDDVDEVALGTDPLDPDTDDDGLVDGDEGLYRADPLNPDTDGDGLTDGDEVHLHGTRPDLSDTDGDGFADGFEVAQGRAPVDEEQPVDDAESKGGKGFLWVLLLLVLVAAVIGGLIAWRKHQESREE